MGGNVLIIDAETDFAEQLAAAVRKVGLSPTVAADGKIGLDLAKQQMPAAIVVCVELPRMSGYSVCTKIRKDDQLKGVPVIITSSGATPETFESHSRLSTRADDYLKKPFDPAMLVAALRPHLAALMNPDLSDEGVEMLGELDEPPVTLGDDEAFSAEEAAVLDADEGMENTSEGIISALSAPASLSQAPGVGPQATAIDDDEAMTSVGKLEGKELKAGGVRRGGAFATSQVGPNASEGAARRQVESLRGELARSQAALEQANKEREEALAQAELLRGSQVPAASSGGRELLELKRAKNEKDKEIQALKQQVAEKEGALLEWRDKELELDESIVRLTEETERLEAARAAAESKGAAEARTSSATIADLKRRLTESSSREADLDGTVQSLQADLDGLRGNLEDQRAVEAELREVQAGTEQRLAAAVTRAGELEAAVEKSRSETAKMTEDRDRTKRDLDQRTKDLDTRTKDLETRSRDLDTRTKELEGRGKELDTRTHERDDLQMALDVTKSEAQAFELRLNAEIEALSLEVDRLTTESEKLSNEGDRLSGEVSRLTNELSAATAEANSLRDQLRQANDDIEVTRASVIELEGVLQTEMTEKDGMRGLIEEISTERERTEGHLSAAYQRVREDEAIRSKALQALEIAVALLKEAGYSATAQGVGDGEPVTGSRANSVA